MGLKFPPTHHSQFNVSIKPNKKLSGTNCFSAEIFKRLLNAMKDMTFGVQFLNFHWDKK